MSECKYCEARGKTWEGSDPECAFPDGIFVGENWNCGAMGKLRAIARENEITYRDDNSCGSFGYVPASDDYATGAYAGHGGFIAMSWYKERGRTGHAVFMDDNGTYPLTMQHVDMAIETHESKRRYANDEA